MKGRKRCEIVRIFCIFLFTIGHSYDKLVQYVKRADIPELRFAEDFTTPTAQFTGHYQKGGTTLCFVKIRRRP